MSNPFEHHHPHYDDADQAAIEAKDPAQQSLTDALRVSFFVLKVIMAALVVVYLFSGFFTVGQNEVAVRLTFGQIVGATPEEQILPRGRLYAGWPFPISRPVKVDISERNVDIHESFWPEEVQRRTTMLNPERDGSLLTADAGLVHGRFRVNYRLGMGHDGAGEGAVRVDPQRCIDYITNVGEREEAERLIRQAARQAMIEFAATIDSDRFLVVDPRRAAAGDRTLRSMIQQALDETGAGILVTGVDVTERRLPGGVQEAQQAANEAVTRRGELVNEARREANEVLAAIAGGAYQSLLYMVDRLEMLSIQIERGMIDDLEQATAERDQLEAALDTALATLSAPDFTRRGPDRTPQQLIEQWLQEHAAIAERGEASNPATMTTPTLAISGRVADTVQTAQAEASRLKRTVATEARTFETLYEQFGRNKETALAIYSHQAIDDLFDTEQRIIPTFYLGDGRLYLDLNIDPEIIERIQRRQREQQQRMQQR